MERKETQTGGKHKRHKMLLRRLRYSTTMRRPTSLLPRIRLLRDNFLFSSLCTRNEKFENSLPENFAFSLYLLLLLLLCSMIYSRKKLF